MPSAIQAHRKGANTTLMFGLGRGLQNVFINHDDEFANFIAKRLLICKLQKKCGRGTAFIACWVGQRVSTTKPQAGTVTATGWVAGIDCSAMRTSSAFSLEEAGEAASSFSKRLGAGRAGGKLI